MRVVWVQDISAVAANLIGLAPLAWLMAQVFMLPNGVGWWATPLFIVPLFTTRLAYHRYVETRELFEQTIEALSKAVDARDPYTRNHSSRVSHISEAMCRVMRLPENDIERIKWAGLLHDIGKIGIRDNILLKEGPLDKHERILMNQHPTIGAEIVAPARQLSSEAPLIKSHHEWFNGSGYPDGDRGARHPARRPHADHRRCLRGDDQLTPVPQDSAHPRAGHRPAREVRRHPVRPDHRAHPRSPGPGASSIGRRIGPDELPTMLHRDEAPKEEDAPATRARTHREANAGLGRCFLAPSCWRSSLAPSPVEGCRGSAS